MNKETLHYTHPTGLALSITTGVIYSLCAFFIVLAPTGAIKFFNYWFHGIDLSKILVIPSITLGKFIVGLITIMLFGYLTGVLYAWLYNKCVGHCKKLHWI